MARIIRIIPFVIIKEIGVKKRVTALRKTRTVTVRLTDLEEKNITIKANFL